MTGANAYWSKGEGFADVIGLTVSSILQLSNLICNARHRLFALLYGK